MITQIWYYCIKIYGWNGPEPRKSLYPFGTEPHILFLHGLMYRFGHIPAVGAHTEHQQWREIKWIK
jgi:hypothetical protein